jgi:opacity protein-like surface antigen
MRALRILMLGLLLALVSATTLLTSASAEDHEVDFSRTGTYIGVSGVYVLEKWPGTNKDAGADDTAGVNIRVGMRVTEWASAEIQLEFVDDYFPDERQDFQTITATVNTRVYPFAGRIQPFAIAGMGIVSSIVDHRDRLSSIKQSNADWGIRAGGGIDFYYTEHVALSLEGTYVFTVGDVKDIDHVSIGLGLLYRF